MSKSPKHIELTAKTNLHKLVEEVHETKEPLVIERDGEALAVIVSPEEHPSLAESIWKHYSPDKVRETLAEMAGTLSEEEAAILISQYRTARKLGSRNKHALLD